MDQRAAGHFPQGLIPHTCKYCEKIVFTLGKSVFFAMDKIKEAISYECILFQIVLERCVDNGAPSDASTVVASCDEGGNITIGWMAGEVKRYNPDDSMNIFSVFRVTKSSGRRQFCSKPVNPSPGSSESIGDIQRWINRCNREHDECGAIRRRLHQKNPSRLIRVSELNTENIIICVPDHDDPVDYAALSYCWGGDQQSTTTTSANLARRLRGFSLDELPPTIKDAVSITIGLGLQYIWVDAICIVQDDKNDKNREMEVMDQIYSGAYVTIAAARAKKATDGFLQSRQLAEIYGVVCQVKCCLSPATSPKPRRCFLSANCLWGTNDDPINERGWTFQERYQSFRTLDFGSKQTIWRCPRSYKVDGCGDLGSGPTSEDRFTGTVADLPYKDDWNVLLSIGELGWAGDLNSFLGKWQLLVQDYSKRELTHRTDRLPAFAAMAKAFGSFLGLKPDQYLAGLWQFDICMQLKWRKGRGVSNNPRPDKDFKPTWSWAPFHGPVYFSHPRLPQGVDTLKFVNCNISRTSPDIIYGKVESAELNVMGFLRESTYSDGSFFNSCSTQSTPIPLPLEVEWDYEEERIQQLWCLEISKDVRGNNKSLSGIILHRLENNTYKRLGYFSLSYNNIMFELIQSMKAGNMGTLTQDLDWYENGTWTAISIE
jgi:hypothetical protein